MIEQCEMVRWPWSMSRGDGTMTWMRMVMMKMMLMVTPTVSASTVFYQLPGEYMMAAERRHKADDLPHGLMVSPMVCAGPGAESLQLVRHEDDKTALLHTPEWPSCALSMYPSRHTYTHALPLGPFFQCGRIHLGVHFIQPPLFHTAYHSV